MNYPENLPEDEIYTAPPCVSARQPQLSKQKDTDMINFDNFTQVKSARKAGSRRGIVRDSGMSIQVYYYQKQDTYHLVLQLTDTVLQDLHWPSRQQVNILYSRTDHQLLLIPGDSYTITDKKGYHELRKPLIHGAHQEPVLLTARKTESIPEWSVVDKANTPSLLITIPEGFRT